MTILNETGKKRVLGWRWALPQCPRAAPVEGGAGGS